MKIGANYLGDNKYEFVVWSPLSSRMYVKIVHPEKKIIAMTKDGLGYWRVLVDEIKPGTKYFYKINNKSERPDPASNYQPDDVHGPSEIVDHLSFNWTDKNWKGIPVEQLIIYELHIGTFTNEGTFEAVIPRLKDLKELGITAIEIMPVSQFSGSRNWGYDGVYHYAPQNSYGGSDGLKKLVDASHAIGISVILDVVYNHLGPEGNYLSQFAPYFTDQYKTPWGEAINFDRAYSDGVRNYFFENAIHWFNNYHVDALRLDAVETIYDMSAKHFLLELSEIVDELSMKSKRKYILIAESDLNDVKVITPKDQNGYGLDTQWSDDFHHSIHAFLTGERNGYYQDFGEMIHIKESIKNKFVYSGKYSSYRKRRHGNDATNRPTKQFVICLQNHDQVGNRAFGERLTSLISLEALKLAAGTMFLSPYIPLLFMGEEYAEESPFLYFISHLDNNLIRAVSEGRKKEFHEFNWAGEIPDPYDEKTFLNSKLNWGKRKEGYHKVLLDFYKALIELRKENPALSVNAGFEVGNADNENIILLSRWSKEIKLFSILNFNKEVVTINIKFPDGNWDKIFDSSDKGWLGPGISTPLKALGKEQNITIKKFSFSLYQTKDK